MFLIDSVFGAETLSVMLRLLLGPDVSSGKSTSQPVRDNTGVAEPPAAFDLFHYSWSFVSMRLKSYPICFCRQFKDFLLKQSQKRDNEPNSFS